MRSILQVPLVAALTVAASCLLPSTASAVTVNEILSLSRAGVSEPVILALIDRDKTIFDLDAEQLITLQKAGISDAIVMAMLRSGRDEPIQVAAPDVPQDTEPDIVVVGQGPDRPNGGVEPSAAPVEYAVPYFVPVPYYAPRGAGRSRCVATLTATRADPSAPTGIFFLNPTHGIFFPPTPVTTATPVVAADCVRGLRPPAKR